MKTVTKELNLLDVEDLEKAISDFLGRKVDISEVDCHLSFCIPADICEPDGMYADFEVDDESFDSFDLFWDDDKDAFCLNGKVLSLSEPYAKVEEIFNFDVSAFKSFETGVDSSD